MKNLLLVAIVFSSLISLAQKTSKSTVFGGITRDYIEYVPAIYDGSEAVPLVLCLHGLGDNMNNFYSVGMNYIADTANFISLTPQALDDVIYGQATGRAWNSGASQYGIVINEDIDDVGFLMELIESTKQLYNIDETKIYVMGFSMGGFMSSKLACQMSGSISAIASVSGTIGSGISCNPEFTVPVCHFHGTIDQTVAYTANAYGNDPEDFVEFWRSHNNCDVSPQVSNLPNLASDGKTVDYYYYGNGDNNSTVEFYKINNGGHEWLVQPTNDISYVIEIWKFFRKQSNLNVSVKEIETKSSLKIYPNPTQSNVKLITNNDQIIGEKVHIYNMQGDLKKQFTVKNEQLTIDISAFEKGVYMVKIGKQIQKLIVE